ncbi:hypothetical protein RDWZM_000608 [Blomia tropicalis]|uniref:BRCT domain-containing protein n=1 Tax=Blomia tropicalis TaxID=40697 RepID=A0A9Q0M959_BLOTA|nr:hypothetical protein RDWZM_000608 [Blomia tropicalis]
MTLNFAVENFSSESLKYPANNLLNSENNSWKCDKWQSYVWIIVQLDQPHQIKSIEICNAYSAFLEVFVSNCAESNFKVFLPVFSCMSPSESRNKSNGKRNFSFKSKHFSQFCRNQSWKYLKIICSQPYNKTIRFGLTFIHISGEPKEPIKFGDCSHFNLAENRNYENLDYISNKDLKYKKDLMAIRETYVKTIATSDEVNGEIKEDRQGQDQRKKKSDKKKSPKIKARTSTSKTPIKDDIAAVKIGKPKNVSTSNNENVESPDNFSSLMSHVVFVLSGFENPFRTELREKAMAMGAQYAPNWNHNCTHLICAFSNTPKYNEVKRLNGRIVSQKWILDSYAQRRLLSWRNFIVGKNGGPNSDQSEEMDDTMEGTPSTSSKKRRKTKKTNTKKKKVDVSPKPTDETNSYNSDEIYDLDTEDDD